MTVAKTLPSRSAQPNTPKDDKFYLNTSPRETPALSGGVAHRSFT